MAFRHAPRAVVVGILLKLYFSHVAAGVAEVEVLYANGLPVINLPLPSRGEICSFTLKPVTSTVGEFIGNLKAEDGGIDRACIYNIGKLCARARVCV